MTLVLTFLLIALCFMVPLVVGALCGKFIQTYFNAIITLAVIVTVAMASLFFIGDETLSLYWSGVAATIIFLLGMWITEASIFLKEVGWLRYILK